MDGWIEEGWAEMDDHSNPAAEPSLALPMAMGFQPASPQVNNLRVFAPPRPAHIIKLQALPLQGWEEEVG